jgi:branched-chain amino acid transport system permease protein
MEKRTFDSGEDARLGFFASLVDKGYDLMDHTMIRWAVYAALIAAAASVPMFANNYVLNVLWNAMFYMLLCIGLNVILGYCGLFDLGYAAKFAIGAYTTGILIKTCGWSFWLTLPASILASVVAACIIGLPTVRLRSDYLAIVTLGFGEIVRITARNLNITGSATGLIAIPRPYFLGIHLRRIHHWYYVFLVLVILFIIVSSRIKNSRFGRALEYIREDEDAAQAMGIDTAKYRLFAFIMGTVLGGIAGSFYAVQKTAISPDSFPFTESANILLGVVLGGMGKIPGVILGAAFFAIFPEMIRDVPFIGNTRMLFFGLLLILVMINRPQGLWPERKR